MRLEKRLSPIWPLASRAVPLLGVALISAWVPASAQTSSFPVWCRRTPVTAPVKLGHPAMVYDTALGAVLLVSRRRCDPVDPPPCPVPTESWMFDGAAWQPLSPATTPGVCLEYVLAHDPVLRKTVLHGPFEVAVGQREMQTWEWDGSTRAWTQRMGTQPPYRVGHAMAYDGQRIILFGGGGLMGVLDDIWEWTGSTWNQLSPANRPPARVQHRMAHHRARDEVVMFGGEFGTNVLDTWVWNGSDWTRHAWAPGDPIARTHHAMTYDVVQDRVLMHGGLGPKNIGFSEVWEWNGTWQLAQPQPCAANLPLPEGRHLHGFAYDEFRRCSEMFGGYGATGWVEDTWEYFVGPPAGYVAFGQGCGPCPPIMTPVPGSLPRLGETFRLNITCVPVWAFPFIGFSKELWRGNTLPLPLDAIGLLGCTLYTGIEAQLWSLLAVNGTATWNLRIPDNASLIGGQVWLQSLVLDPQANNLGLVLSNAGEVTVGLK